MAGGNPLPPCCVGLKPRPPAALVSSPPDQPSPSTVPCLEPEGMVLGDPRPEERTAALRERKLRSCPPSLTGLVPSGEGGWLRPSRRKPELWVGRAEAEAPSCGTLPQFPRGDGKRVGITSSAGWLQPLRLNTKQPSLPSPALDPWLLGLAGCFAVFVSISAEQ